MKDLKGKHFLLGKIKIYLAAWVLQAEIINRFKNNLDKFMDERLSSIQKIYMCLHAWYALGDVGIVSDKA